MAARVYWLWLANRPGITSRAAAALLEHFGSPEAIYSAGRDSLQQFGGLSHAQLESLCNKDLSAADRLLEECAEKNIHMITLEDSNYPERLSNIYDPPLVLYWRGKPPAWDSRPMITIVGSRRSSGYGRMYAERFARSLTECGFLVVSGMANGIDGAANQAAMRSGGTVAVLGCGVDVCYPPENRYLYGDLLYGGTIISEYPPGTEPAAWHFPVRNRILSGLSVAVIVIEAPIRSGALITAHLALDQGRDVYAVPGRLGDWRSEGCNALVRDHESDLLTDPLQLIYAYGGLLREVPDEQRVMRLFGGSGYGGQNASLGRRNRQASAQRPQEGPPQETGEWRPARKRKAPQNDVPEEAGASPQNGIPEEAAASPQESVPEEAVTSPQESVPEEVAASPQESVPEEFTASPQDGVPEEAAASPQDVAFEEAAASPQDGAFEEAAASPQDIAPEEAAAAPQHTFPEGLAEYERKILEAVRLGAQSTDRLIDATGIPAAQLLPMLTMLELNAMLKNEGGVISLM